MAKHTEPGEFTDSELHSSRIDQHKAQIDVLKHVATLDTAVLLVVVAMVEKVFKTPHAQVWIGAAVLCLLTSLLGSGLSYLSLRGAFPRKGARRFNSQDRREHMGFMLTTFLGFLFGIFSIAIFFALNWSF